MQRATGSTLRFEFLTEPYRHLQVDGDGPDAVLASFLETDAYLLHGEMSSDSADTFANAHALKIDHGEMQITLEYGPNGPETVGISVDDFRNVWRRWRDKLLEFELPDPGRL